MNIAIISTKIEEAILAAASRASLQPVMYESGQDLELFDGFVLLASMDDTPALYQQIEKGKPVLGLGLGAAYLLEIGCVPGVEGNKPVITLHQELDRQQNTMRLRKEYQYNAFTRCLTPDTHLPVSSLIEQNLFCIPNALFEEMQIHGLTVFQHNQDSAWIAAVANKKGNVMAMLSTPFTTPSGDMLFRSMREYIQTGYCQKVEPLHYYPR